MITGFNTDIDHEDRVFHVQTEDKGRQNPAVESLVYCGGEIITSKSTSYEDLAKSARYSEEEVLRRMEVQHQALIRDIYNGKFDAEGPKPFGHNIITNRSLDDVVLGFLEDENSDTRKMLLELIDEQVFLQGTRPTVRVKILDQESGQPVPDAELTISLVPEPGQPVELFSAKADEDGFVEASFEIPMIEGAVATLLCRASATGAAAEIRQPIEKNL